MSGKTCTGPGHDGGLCGRKHEAHGLCKSHYSQWWLDPDRPLRPLKETRPGLTCNGPGVDGGLCGRKHEAHGLCNGHYLQQKAGKELTPLKQKAKGLTCNGPGHDGGLCGKPVDSHGLCSQHARQQREGKELTPLKSKRLTDEQAIAEMERLMPSFQPRSPFPGVSKAWDGMCLECGNPVGPRLDNIRSGQGGCDTCSEGGGFKSHLPGVFYFISGTGKTTGLDMIKCGIANTHCHKSRLRTHKNQGLDNVHHVIHFDLGADAEAMEKLWKEYLEGLPTWTRPTKADLPKGGWTEAVMAHGPHFLWIERLLSLAA